MALSVSPIPFTVKPSDLVHPDHHLRDVAVAQLERESRNRSEDLAEYRGEILAMLDLDEVWTIRLHVVRLLGRLKLLEVEHARRLEYLFAEATGSNRFVSAWAIDALSMLAIDDESIRARVWDLIRDGLESRSSAVRVRARHSMERLTRAEEK